MEPVVLPPLLFSPSERLAHPSGLGPCESLGRVFSLVEECPVDEGAWNGECAQKKLAGSTKAELELNNPERGLPTDREASVRRVGRLEIKIAYRYA